MSTHYLARVERRDFGDLLSVDGLSRLEIQTTSEYGALQSPSGNTVLAIWPQDPKEASQPPRLLICADGSESDWAAWITTFAERMRPFSAYMRLLSDEGLKKIVQETRAPTLGRLEWPVAGLVLAEALAASRLPDKALETLSATACASTLSFTMFRAAATYFDFKQWSYLVDSWESVRRVTKQRARQIDGAAVARVCAIIMSANGLLEVNNRLTGSDNMTFDACHELISTPERVPTSLCKDPYFAEAEGKMHGPREDRVIAFEEFVRIVDNSINQKSELTSLMLGYLASKIAPGTIRHSSVLRTVANRYPTAVLWYGFCAGLGGGEINTPDPQRRRSVDLPASARRILRDLLRTESILDLPTCDIGFLELEALSRTSGDPLEGLITMTQGTAIIELAPYVWTIVTPSSRQSAEIPVGIARDQGIIAALGKQIDRLREIYEDLAGNEPADPYEQPSLFPQRRKKKYHN